MNDVVMKLPDPPEKPLASDCCGNGCTPCVLDIYEEDLRIWKLECEMMQRPDREKDVAGNFENGNQSVVMLEPQCYNKFMIANISMESHDTLRIKFSLNPSQTLGLATGQHLIIRASSSNGSTLTRQFTPISPIDTKGYFEIIIKVYSDGRMSKHVKKWKIGDGIEMRGPFGGYDYIPNKYNHTVMLCAGTGIAPMSQVINAILSNEQDETRIRLLYACRTYQDVLAKSEMDEWKQFWNFSSTYILSQEPESPDYSYKYGDVIHRGRIDQLFLQSEFHMGINKTFVLICGTSSFDSDIQKYLSVIGVPQNRIYTF